MTEQILVTGAGSGIGREFVTQFLAQGAKVLAVSLLQDELDSLQADLNPSGSHLVTLAMDLSTIDAADQLFDYCQQHEIIVDVLVNNAGFACFGETTALNAERMTNQLLLNCVTLTKCCQLFGAQMQERGSGHILNLGSTAGMIPAPRLASYGGSKAYVNNFSYALRSELKPYGVNVTCMTPGMVQTGFSKAAGIDQFEGSSILKQAYTTNRATTPATVAAAGIKGMYARKAQVLTGKGSRMAAIGSMLLPPTLLPLLVKNP